jgi:hypothetical protein
VLTPRGRLFYIATKSSLALRRKQSGSIRKKKWKLISRLTKRAWLTQRLAQPVTRFNGAAGVSPVLPCTAVNGSSRGDARRSIIKLDLAHYQHFPYGVARQKKFDRREIAKEVFDVPVIKYALQTGRLLFRRRSSRRRELYLLHFKHVAIGNVVAITGRVGTSISRVKERQ